MTESFVSIVKTASGDDVIGTVSGAVTNSVVIDDALVFVGRSIVGGETGIHLVKYMPYSETTSVELGRASVVCITRASAAMSAFYKASVAYNKGFDKKIDAAIYEAANYMNMALSIDAAESSGDYVKQKIDILSGFTSNTKN